LDSPQAIAHSRSGLAKLAQARMHSFKPAQEPLRRSAPWQTRSTPLDQQFPDDE
jgi:hypothetical protein